MILYSGLLQKLNEKGLTKTAMAKYRGYHQRTASHFEAKQHTKGHFIFYLGGCPFVYIKNLEKYEFEWKNVFSAK